MEGVSTRAAQVGHVPRLPPSHVLDYFSVLSFPLSASDYLFPLFSFAYKGKTERHKKAIVFSHSAIADLKREVRELRTKYRCLRRATGDKLSTNQKRANYLQPSFRQWEAFAFRRRIRRDILRGIAITAAVRARFMAMQKWKSFVAEDRMARSKRSHRRAQSNLEESHKSELREVLLVGRLGLEEAQAQYFAYLFPLTRYLFLQKVNERVQREKEALRVEKEQLEVARSRILAHFTERVAEHRRARLLHAMLFGWRRHCAANHKAHKEQLDDKFAALLAKQSSLVSMHLAKTLGHFRHDLARSTFVAWRDHVRVARRSERMLTKHLGHKMHRAMTTIFHAWHKVAMNQSFQRGIVESRMRAFENHKKLRILHSWHKAAHREKLVREREAAVAKGAEKIRRGIHREILSRLYARWSEQVRTTKRNRNLIAVYGARLRAVRLFFVIW